MSQEEEEWTKKRINVFEIPTPLLNSLVVSEQSKRALKISTDEENHVKEEESSTQDQSDISGSEDESDDETSEEDKKRDFSAENARIREKFESMGLNRVNNNNNDDEQLVLPRRTSARIYFESPLLSKGKCLAVYSHILSRTQLIDPVSGLGSLQQPNDSIYVLLMIGGGYFAGAVIENSFKKNTIPQQPIILAHKTFARYTTRRKQGGSQSANDNANGKAKSAGSNLRRYNELALEQEVRELLGCWKNYINQAKAIFIRATGASNRSILMGYSDDAPIKSSKDQRIRGFPFTTRRATGQEILRAWMELSRARIVDLPPLEPVAVIKEKSSLLPQPKEDNKRLPPSPQEIHTLELVAIMRRRSKFLPALATYISKHNISVVDFRLEPQNRFHYTPTLLHYASSQGLHFIVYGLLTQLNADPTILNYQGRTPFDLARDRATKDSFRLARGELGNDKYDWKATHIPSPITQKELEARQQAEKRQADEAKHEQAHQRKLEMEKIKHAEQEKEMQQKKLSSSSQRLGSSTTTNDAQTRGLSQEAKVKLERERRARAAEARLVRKT